MESPDAEPEVVGADVGPRFSEPDRTPPELVVAGSFEHQQLIAVAALAQAAGVVLDHPKDPLAAEAEAQFETVLEVVIQLHWVGEGNFDGVAHPGMERQGGRVLLSGVARVRGGPDRPVRVNLSPTTGGEVIIETPAPKRGGLRRAKVSQVQSTRIVRIPSSAEQLGRGYTGAAT